jgi:hypothetical protein
MHKKPIERLCSICQKLKITPYKDICRSCYQSKWALSINPKVCADCLKTFKTSGKICLSCARKVRLKNKTFLPCNDCQRKNVLITNIGLNLCTKCTRNRKDKEIPGHKEKRIKQNRGWQRKSRGIPIDLPLRKSKGYWKTPQGYIMIYKKGHPNANANDCIQEHCYVMSEYIKRPLKRNESVHHKNGIRDDNRIENLELWHRGQPSGQRLEEKIQWAKSFLEEYGFKIEKA